AARQAGARQHAAGAIAELIGDARLAAIRSPCGTGKSTQLATWVGPRAVYVTHRCSHATQVVKRLGFVDYRSVKGQIDLSQTPRIVVQVESLNRINPSGKTFDLILDEWASLLRQFNSHLAVKKGAFRHLERISKAAQRTIALDGHLADADVAVLGRVVGGEPFVVHNACRPYTATYCVYPKSAACLQSLLDHAAAGNRALCVFHSKKALEATKAVLEKRLPDCKILAYTSESSSADRRAFESVDDAWREAQIVLYTSTVEVGIDCTLPEFGRVYIFIASPDVTATQTAQMAFRARAVTAIHIAVEPSAAAARRLRASPENIYDLRALYTSWGEHPDLPADLAAQTELSPEGLS
ncbi:MAG: hypothetical protein AAB262_03915, partial [Elusimicrobiota bacterium]